MDFGLYKSDKPNPKENANILSILTFWYNWPVFLKASKNVFEVSDLYETLSSQQSKLLGDRIAKIWRKEELNALKLNKKPSLTKVLFKMFGPEYLGLSIIAMFAYLGAEYDMVIDNLTVINYDCSRLLQPVILGRLIEYYTMGQVTKTKTDAYWLALGLVFCTLFFVQVTGPNNLAYMQIGMKARVACSSLVYRKAIRLSKTALGQTSAGQMVNLVSSDVNKFDTFITTSHYLWIGPLQTIVGSFIMYHEVGISAVIGVVVLLLFLPIQFGVAKINAIFRSKSAKRTDKRVRLMTELISGIQIIKMYAWEKPFTKIVSVIRRNEMKFIQIASCFSAIVSAIFPYFSQFCLFISMISCIALNENITAKKVFVLISFFNILRRSMCAVFTAATGRAADVSVSLKRLNNFLILDEKFGVPVNQVQLSKYSVKHQDLTDTISTESGKISIKGGAAKWNESSTDYVFKNLNITVKPGSIVAVIGPVGSGKSSLLQLLLKELPLAEGDLKVYGDISYASQEPWIFSGTIRQNILFNKPYSKDRYESVLFHCSLKRDLELYKYADMSDVGELGMTLSGGQRARISLARAIYREADIYLLDDPLSAVDTHVARELFEECVTDFLRGKTVILVTHQVQFLKDVDNIIVIENGAIKEQGTFDELQQSGLEFAKILKTEGQKEDKPLVNHNLENANSSHQLTTYRNEEQRTLGIVPMEVYKIYISGASNWFYTFIVLSLFLISQVGISFGEVFLSDWVAVEESNRTNIHAEEFNRNQTSYSYWDFSRATYINVYTGVLIFTIIVTSSSSLIFNILCMRSSVKLHHNMFKSIIKGTMRFFYLNPAGRILNRFSKDMSTIDNTLPAVVLNAIQCFLLLLGMVVVISTVNLWFLIPTVILFVLFYVLSSFYLMTSRNVKRLEGITKSPVLGHVNSSIQGLTTIRSVGAESTLIDEFDHLQDLHSEAWFLFISSSQAFGYYLDTICVMYICIITFGSLIIGDVIPSASMGLVITQALGLISLFQWATRQCVEMENQMISVERVLEYNNVEHEKSPKCEGNEKRPPSWPQRGEIRFINVELRYSPNNSPVLKNLFFTIKPLEKVGIVGRTGAGKSSLINALFQLSDTSGMILIDDIDIKGVELEHLRSKISIIPQEPVLFLGTIRQNLDPLGVYNDELLWKALENVELKGVIKELDQGLDGQVWERGSNFSVGQRQLICLARAILRNNKILVLDEATANVDSHTDALIQKTIRTEFAQCTVLTIAHRLNTVIDSDKILVLEDGEIIEVGHPYNLLQNTSGVFYGMVLHTGPAMAASLIKTAKKVLFTSYVASEMDLGLYKSDKPNPRENANIFSISTFGYIWPTFLKARTKEIEVSDLYETISSQQSKFLGDKIEKMWRTEELKALKLNKKPSLTKVLVKAFGAEYFGHAIMCLLGDFVVAFLQPLILGEYIDYYTTGQATRTKTDAYWLAFGVVLCTLFFVQIAAPNTLAFMEVGMKVRAIRLSKTALRQTTVGQMVNLLSNDVRRFDTLFFVMHYIWTGPLETIIGLFIMYQVMGISAIIGVAVLMLFIPIQFGAAKMSAKFRSKSAQRTDERVRLVTEIISGIQIVKMYAWEKPFAKLVSVIRRNEMKFIRISSCLRTLVFSFYPYSTQLCLFIAIVSCIVLNENVTAKKVFVLVAYLSILRRSMSTVFGQAATELAEVSVSLKRLNTFLTLHEKIENEVSSSQYSTQQEDVHSNISIKNGTISVIKGAAKWNNTDYIFKNLNIKVKPSSIVAVIGPVGSGKSSFLQLLLKELPLAEGDLEVYGDISYASQEPWVFNGTIRQNILFNKPYSKDRYENVISKCALKRDLELLASADMTFVGDRGVTLSGGQRARISLARAIYREADIYLLDDPLSAVDAHVARQLFEECVTGLLRGKTVILVTHQVQFLKDVDTQGTFDELQQSGLEFAKLLKKEELDEHKPLMKHNHAHAVDVHNKISYRNEEQKALGTFLLVKYNFIIVNCRVDAEERSTETNADEFNINVTSRHIFNFSRATYMNSYTGMVVATVTLTIFRNLIFNILCMRSSMKLHNNMFNSIINGTMRFFNLNPAGRILNRFSKDMGTIDDTLPSIMLNSIQYVLLFLGLVLVISAVNPWFLIPTLILFVYFYFAGSFYLMTSRNVKRIEGITKSPVFGHINSSIQGLTTIRAFRAESALIEEFDHLQDLHTESWFLFISSSSAFGYYLDISCVIYITIITFGSLLIGGGTSDAKIGLVVTQALALIGLFQWATRQCVEMENQMTSVERVLEYNNIEHEKSPKSDENKKPPASWPQSGEIKFVNVDLRYSSTDFPVLKNLSFTIKPQEKVGIVGRTGAGKSSLINALFQLSDTSGSILIDGTDIKGVELEHLRTKISIIPQEPVLFSGTVRKNLDPFGVYTDELLWKSLENVELKGAVKEFDLEDGSNFSVGQRQLICLARAILRNNKILVLDEATANTTIRKQFAQCTVLTIAHRLNTVMDADKILVMEQGAMIEFDHPYNLLQNTGGTFYGMVLQTGSAMASTLTRMAEEVSGNVYGHFLITFF
ncbi:hypothetical protein RI129_005346 [Pyrocoelia pectoralis]|uniref:Uncharacterized protein n=1 Tax=Pyrocoelia pectoralis TaxID=417401 RepID=A0AAN7ZLF6_9COLE